MLKKILSSLCLTLLSFSALASNYGFMNDTASSYFTQADWNIFNRTRQIALDRGKTGVKINWRNPNSGSYGFMIPGSPTRQNNLLCRTLTYYSTANLIKGGGSYRFCKTRNGWMIY